MKAHLTIDLSKLNSTELAALHSIASRAGYDVYAVALIDDAGKALAGEEDFALDKADAKRFFDVQ